MTTTTDTAPSLYIACLAAYNAGRLHGVWIDLTEADDDTDPASIAKHVGEAAAAMIAASPAAGAEEYDVHDREGFGSFAPGSIDAACKYAATVAELESDGMDNAADVLAAYASIFGEQILTDDQCTADRCQDITDRYRGQWETGEKFIEEHYYEYTDDVAAMPAHLAYHIDWSGVWRDCDWASVAGAGHYFDVSAR